MTVLALSTSTPRASVALLDGDRVLAEVTYDDPRGHAERLFSLVDEAFAAASAAGPAVTRSCVHIVACDVGPGSFTGVRIAVASAKGVAVALGVPLAGVPSLDAMIARARAEHPAVPLVVAAIDAKKEELYVAVHSGDTTLLPPSHLPRRDVAPRLAELLGGRDYVAAVETADLCEGWPPAASGAPAIVCGAPSAAWIARLAAASPASHGDPADVTPLYVRAPDAVASFSVGPDPFAMLPPR